MEENKILNKLKNLELKAVIFIMDYIQLELGEVKLSVYTLPNVMKNGIRTMPSNESYPYELKSLIGEKIKNVNHRIQDESIEIEFTNKTILSISLKESDKSCAEVMMINFDNGKDWAVW